MPEESRYLMEADGGGGGMYSDSNDYLFGDNNTIGADGGIFGSPIYKAPAYVVAEPKYTGANIYDTGIFGNESYTRGMFPEVPGELSGGVPAITPAGGIRRETVETPQDVLDYLRGSSAKMVGDQEAFMELAKNNQLDQEMIDYLRRSQAGISSEEEFQPQLRTPSQIGIPLILPPIPGMDPTTALILSGLGLILSGGQIPLLDPNNPMGSILDAAKGTAQLPGQVLDVITGDRDIFNPSGAGSGASSGAGGTGTGMGPTGPNAPEDGSGLPIVPPIIIGSGLSGPQNVSSITGPTTGMDQPGGGLPIVPPLGDNSKTKQPILTPDQQRELLNKIMGPCPDGMMRDASGNCVPIPPPPPPPPLPECPVGQQRDASGNCVPIPPPPPKECPAGQQRDASGKCVPISQPPPTECPAGQQRDANGKCVPIFNPPPPEQPPTECPVGQQRDASGKCVPILTPPPPEEPPTKCPAGQQRDASGKCVPIFNPPPPDQPPSECPPGMERGPSGNCVPIFNPPPPVTPPSSSTTTSASPTFVINPITTSYTLPTTGTPAMRNLYQEATTSTQALGTPMQRAVIGVGADGKPIYGEVPIDPATGQAMTVSQGIASGYGGLARGMTQQDISNLLQSIQAQTGAPVTGGYQAALTRAANEQTAASNTALRSGNIADAEAFAMRAKALRDQANASLFGQGGALPQFTQQAQEQVGRDVAALRAAEAGQLSPEQIRNAQQAAREAYGARGQVFSQGAAAQEVLNRAAAVQQQQQLARQNLAQSMGQLGGAIGYQTANVFDPFATTLGGQYGMQTQNIGQNQALYNQAMGLTSGAGGYGFAQQMINPFSAYAGDVYGTNVNAVNAAQIAAANRQAALEAAKMGQTGTYAQALGNLIASGGLGQIQSGITGGIQGLLDLIGGKWPTR
jgi:hypothetical protein